VKKVSNFKQFNESVSNHLTKDDIEDVFMDLIDDGYLLTVYGDGRLDKLHPGSYYFDLRRQFVQSFDFDIEALSYGCRDLDSMQFEVKKVFEILKDAKHKLNSMGYDIGFEPEFSFSEDTLFCIVCHLSLSKDKSDEQ
jgi:hypothetical protein